MAGIATGSESMMSATVIPSMRSVKAVEVIAARAPCARKNPTTASHRPLRSEPLAATKMPRPMSR